MQFLLLHHRLYRFEAQVDESAALVIKFQISLSQHHHIHASGILDNLDEAYGIHFSPFVDQGKIGIHEEETYVGSSTFDIVIQDKVVLKGTTRYSDEPSKDIAYAAIKNQVEGLEKTFGGKVNLDYHFNYPVLYNHNENNLRIEYINT
ncbi:hypothetical protein QA540_01915 [Macrococcus psychrotolerans]|uniref:Uncharacterized protein n=1 Tax=Macrococcus psychrotolerans TaxID=3039389 RepID=A0AAU6RGP5_9STAP